MKNLFIGFFSFINLFLFSQTNVSGVINTNTTWTLANSPYVVTGNILVQPGITLNIQPGVIINVNSNSYIRIDGVLVANGTLTQNIIFQSSLNNNSLGSWIGILIKPSSISIIDSNQNYVSGNLVNHVKIKNANIGLYCYQKSVFVKNTSFEFNNKAIEIRNTTNLLIDSSSFNNNNVGIYSEYEANSPNDITNDIKKTFIRNSSFHNNLNGIDFNLNQRSFDTLIVENNIFKNNNVGFDFSGGGYGCRLRSVNFLNNVFLNNSIGLQIGQIYGYGTSMFSPEPQGVYSLTIEKNKFVNNPLICNYGGGVSGVLIKISNNIIYNPSSGSISTLHKNGLYFTGGTSRSDLITKNYIFSNGKTLNLEAAYTNPSNKIFSYNTFEGEPISSNSIINIYGQGHVFNNNNISFFPNKYSIKLNGLNNINAENNYWGINDQTQINSLTFDFFDDFSVGTIDNVPYQSNPVIDAPIKIPTNVSKIQNGSNVILNWSANIESDIVGYKLYFGNPTGYSYDSVINIGNITSYTISNGNINTEYAITAYDNLANGINDQVDGNESWFSIANKPPELPTNIVIDAAPRRSKLTWSLSSSNSVLCYNIYRDTIPNPTILYANVSKTTSSFLDSGLVNGTNYYYRIKSIDSSGLSSAYSQNYTITPTNIWYVSNLGTQNGFGSINSPMNSIQTAINSSVNGEVIKVSNGTYFESISFNGKSVVIESNFASTNDVLDIENTIINGNNLTFPVVNFSNSENQNSKLIGFKIINGNGKNIIGNWGLGTHGGGIFIKNASPTIKNCYITNNNSQNGGGIYAENSQSIFENLKVHGNNINQQNIPNGGSGLFLLNSNTSIVKCEIYNNSDNPINGVSNYGGGGILIFGGSANIISSKIVNNTSKGYGGGISLLSGASAIFDNSIISNNNGGLNGNYTGGGIYSDDCNITLKNCVLWGNTKNGITINGYPNVSILNSIIYNNTPNQIVGGFNNNITFSDIQGGNSGLGNININPSFINPISNDFNIRPYSQCIGLGSNIGINQFDINTQNRPTPLGSNCDIGAYELIQGTPSNAPPSLIAPLIHSSIEDSLSKIFLTNINDGDLFNTQNISLTILSGNSSILNNFQVALNQQQDSAVISYIPITNQNGNVPLTIIIKDNGGILNNGLDSSIVNLNIFVSAVNDLPIAINDTINTSEDITATINLLLNDSDVDNSLNATTIDLNQITPGVQNSINNLAGVWSVNNQGVLTFSPALNYNGTSTIQYTVSDASSGVSNVAQVFAQVSSVNDAPIASNDVITTLEDTPVMLDLLMNDSDIDNALDSSSIDLDLTATGIQNTVTTVGGVLSVTSTGVLNFTPNLNYNGVITRTYKVNDVLGLQSNTATITITVSAVNDLPDSIYLSNNTQFENQIGGIGLLTTIDVDNNQTYTYSLVSGIGSNDNLSFSIINNQLQNIIPFNFESNNQLSIRVRSTDNGGLSKEIIFLVNVLNVNDIQVIDTINNTFCNGINGSGAISISYLETNGSVNFNWTGPNSFIATTQNISGLESGLYTLSLSDSLDTVVFNYNLNQTLIYNDLNICFVSSDSLLGNLNRIYFNNPSMYNVEFFEILKESSVQGVYNVIDQISSTDSSFLDLTSNNQVQNYSYKIRSIDSCGNYSNLSLEHKTILLQSNISANSSVNLLWTPYIGITYGTYYVYRSVNNNPYTLLVSLPSSQLNYNDISADVLTNSYKYFVSITTAGCDFTKSTNLIRSNIELVSSVSVKINESLDIFISPNPSNGLYKIQNNSNYLISNYFVYNNEGQIILEDKEAIFDLSQFENGFYFLEIVLNNGYRFKRKLVKN